MTTRVLPFDRAITPQETGYWCGPASAQVALSVHGIRVDEATLARECRTHTGGTDNVGLIERVLDTRLPAAKYTSVYPGGERIGSPAKPVDVRRDWFRNDVVSSINRGSAVILNWVVPTNNKPRGVKGSANPSYGGKSYHYVTVVGWSDEGNDGRLAVLIADSGFRPYVYWMDFEQAFSLIGADLYKGYAYAAAEVRAPAAVPPPPTPAPPPVTAPKPARLPDPSTARRITKNKYSPRGMGWPKWIAVHTSESASTVDGLAAYCERAGVSYNRLVSDVAILTTVADADAPWAASNGNRYAFHLCFSHSFAGWSRDKWLDPTVADGYNEDAALTNAARVAAWWCQEHEIPPVWIGGRGKPPWGLDGILGHVDLGAWGGGHTDPGGNFPVTEFIRRVSGILTGSVQPPLVTLPPVVLPGTDPDKYAGVMLYRGRIGNDPALVRAVQRRLKAAFAGYAGHLVIDGDFGSQTQAAVREFQRRSGLVADGIVGPMTAAALKAW